MLMTEVQSVCETSADFNKWMLLSTRGDFVEYSFQKLISGDFVSLDVHV
jgi:hypothetical protein